MGKKNNTFFIQIIGAYNLNYFKEYRLDICKFASETMEPIYMVSKYETKYLRAVAAQKSLQKDQKSREAARAQSRVMTRAKKYGKELVRSIIQESASAHLVRKYVIGPKYAMDIIVQSGQITIYSHPQNPSVKPKLEVHHVSYGFIAWWHREDFDHPQLWEYLCELGKFDPTNTDVISSECKRLEEILRTQ